MEVRPYGAGYRTALWGRVAKRAVFHNTSAWPSARMGNRCRRRGATLGPGGTMRPQVEPVAGSILTVQLNKFANWARSADG
jgi:hypothetical protein